MRHTSTVVVWQIAVAGTDYGRLGTNPARCTRINAAFETTKVEGTDNVYVFRYQNHQSMFVVTSDGVIATDPVGLGRPQAVTAYIDEIKKVTSQPVKYVIYSHNHYDHITGGEPFKDLGARFIAHKNAKAQVERLQPPDIVLPDEVVDTQRTITLGGTTLELLYVGRNHSDNSLVMRLPNEKLIFAVDFIRSRPCSGAACQTAGSMSGRRH